MRQGIRIIPALKKDIVNEIYANLSVILGIIFVALLFAKYIRRGFFFFFVIRGPLNKPPIQIILSLPVRELARLRSNPVYGIFDIFARFPVIQTQSSTISKMLCFPRSASLSSQ